jgi:hypothetical protein
MNLLYNCRGMCLSVIFLAAATAGRSQGVSRLGGEFGILPLPVGDQVLPSVSLGQAGCVLAFVDHGIGVRAATLDANLTAQSYSTIHKAATADQVKPAVKSLRNGNTFNGNNIFVWQSKAGAIPGIYARLAKGTNFLTPDIRVNSYIKDQNVDPAATATLDGGAMVAWASYGQGGGQWGIYVRKVTATGALAGAQEFRVNEFTNNTVITLNSAPQQKSFSVNQFTGNQRTPAVCTLANGNVVVAWASDAERSPLSRDIYARVFTAAGMPATPEILVNVLTNQCSFPAVAPLNNGGFTVAWTERDTVPTNSLDVWGRAFSGTGTPAVKPFRINSYLYGDQYQPKLASGPNGVLAVWTSLGQDGDREGVFGRFLAGGTQVSGPEFQVNTTTTSQQLDPEVAWNGVDRFLVVWTSFTSSPARKGVPAAFALFGQMYKLSQ